MARPVPSRPRLQDFAGAVVLGCVGLGMALAAAVAGWGG